MKTRKILTLLLGIFVAAMIVSCENNDPVVMPEESILPEHFSIDIPDALSRQGAANAKVAVDTLDGNVIYMHLTNFIHVGEKAAEIVEDIIRSIVLYGINKPISFSFEGQDDGRTKNLDVIKTSFFYHFKTFTLYS